MNFEEWLTAIELSEGGTLVAENIRFQMSHSPEDAARMREAFESSGILNSIPENSEDPAKDALKQFRDVLVDKDSELRPNEFADGLGGFCEKSSLTVGEKIVCSRVETLPGFIDRFCNANVRNSSQWETDSSEPQPSGLDLIGQLNDENWLQVCNIFSSRRFDEIDKSCLSGRVAYYIQYALREFKRANPKEIPELEFDEVAPSSAIGEAPGEEVRTSFFQSGQKLWTVWLSPLIEGNPVSDAIKQYTSDADTISLISNCKALNGLVNAKDCDYFSDGGLPKYHFGLLLKFELDPNILFRPNVWADGFNETFAQSPSDTADNVGLSVNIQEKGYGECGGYELVALAQDIAPNEIIVDDIVAAFVPVERRSLMPERSEHIGRIKEVRF